METEATSLRVYELCKHAPKAARNRSTHTAEKDENVGPRKRYCLAVAKRKENQKKKENLRATCYGYEHGVDTTRKGGAAWKVRDFDTETDVVIKRTLTRGLRATA